jgi:hypothetical protein
VWEVDRPFHINTGSVGQPPPLGHDGFMAVDEQIQWEVNVVAANWIGSHLHPFNQDTGSVVPEGIEVYCRIFHPDGPIYPDGTFRSWAEIAENDGRIAHPSMQFHMIDRPMGSPVPDPLHEGSGPSAGTFPPRERERLVDLLGSETGTPDLCWFCIWEGYGNIDVPRPLVQPPGRNYGLYRGPIDLAMAAVDAPWNDQSPNLWWPEDRAWIVATEVDYAWTYVGGSQKLIDNVVSDDLLEAMPIHLDDLPFWTGDPVNVDVKS